MKLKKVESKEIFNYSLFHIKLELIKIEMSNTILYEDKDVQVTEKEIKIKCYFFPTAQSKVIPIENIKLV